MMTKKFFLLPVLMLLFAACSNDDSIMEMQQDQAAEYYGDFEMKTLPPAPSCFTAFSAYTMINVANGFGNPMVEFYLNISVPAQRRQFIGYLEVQPLADCEDLSSAAGTPTVYNIPGYIQLGSGVPALSLSPSQLPATCYKWRFVANAAPGYTACQSVTEWYESPLF